MFLSLSQILNRSNYLNLVFALIPLSFIAGNTIININILLLIFSSIFLYRKNIFGQKLYFLDTLIISFFLLILFTSFFNNLYLYYGNIENFPRDFGIILKSLSYLRFLLLYFVIRFLLENKILDLKFFFISSFLFSLFVSLDLYFQLSFGKDIFGYEGEGRKLAGPFGDEKIAGSYLQRFALFSFFLFPIFLRDKTNKILKFIIPILAIIFFSAILISGNRMPMVLFLMSLILIILFQKEVRKYTLVFLIIFSLSFILIFKFNLAVQKNLMSFYIQIQTISKVLAMNINDKEISNTDYVPQYYKEFSTFYDTWLMNKYIGGGIKSFRYYCHVRPNISKNSNFICNMHPHNYYLEILTETGIFGFLIIFLIFINTFYLSFVRKYLIETSLKYNHIITPFMILFLVEIFPLKSTGSFFTTANATFLFLVMSITIALTRKKI